MPTEAQELKREMLQTGVNHLLDKHQVPARQLLAALKRIETLSKEHAADIEDWQSTHEEFKETLTDFQEILKIHKQDRGVWSEEAERLTSIDHLKGEPGISVDFDEVIRALIPLLPKPKEVDTRNLVAEVLELMPKPEVKEEREELDLDAIFEDFIKRIQEEKRIDVSHLRNAQSFIFNGKKYKIEELMRGAGGTGANNPSAVTVQVTGTQSGDNVLIDLSAAPISGNYSSIQFVTKNGQVLMPNGSSAFPGSSWSQSGSIITVYNADAASDIFLIQYVPNS